MGTEGIEGGCFCGAVRYLARRPPAISTICHCRSCRRAAGAPFVAWVTFAADDLSFVRGVPAQLRSSPPVTRTFCAACGTPLTYAHAGRPGEIDVTTASLDAPDAFPPVVHLWCSEAVAWATPRDGLPTLPHGTDGA